MWLHGDQGPTSCSPAHRGIPGAKLAKTRLLRRLDRLSVCAGAEVWAGMSNVLRAQSIPCGVGRRANQAPIYIIVLGGVGNTIRNSRLQLLEMP